MEIKCRSCGSNIWYIKAKGLCYKCYPLIHKIETIKAWDKNQPESMVPISGVNAEMLSYIGNLKEFEDLKKRIIHQYEHRLSSYKKLFSDDIIDGLDLEHMFRRFSVLLANGNKDRWHLFHGYANNFSHDFDNHQRKFIYNQLLTILINRRFKLNWNKIYQDR